MNEDGVTKHVQAHFERSYRAPAPGFGARMRAGLTGAPRIARRPRWAVGLVAVILAASAVLALTLPRLLSMGTLTPGNRTQGVIPWVSLPANLDLPVTPSPTPIPLPSGTQPCVPGQVQVDVLGNNGAGGHVFRSFGFSGLGPKACFLNGVPTIALFDASGHHLPVQSRAPFLLSTDPGAVLLEPGPLPDPNTEMKPGQAAVTIEWASAPEGCPKGPAPVHIAMVKITLPTGGPALTAHLTAEPTAYVCGGLGVGSFQGPPPTVEEPPLLPLPTATLKVPVTAHAGSDLVYEVTLTNGTATAIDLIANCPNFGQDVFPGDLNGSPPRGIKPLYQLNCKPAGTIKPALSLTFEIHLAIPPDTAPGTYTVFFALSYWNERTNPASARVTIR